MILNSLCNSYLTNCSWEAEVIISIGIDSEENDYFYRKEEMKARKMNIFIVCCLWTDEKLCTFCCIRYEWDL